MVLLMDVVARFILAFELATACLLLKAWVSELEDESSAASTAASVPTPLFNKDLCRLAA